MYIIYVYLYIIHLRMHVSIHPCIRGRFHMHDTCSRYSYMIAYLFLHVETYIYIKHTCRRHRNKSASAPRTDSLPCEPWSRSWRRTEDKKKDGSLSIKIKTVTDKVMTAARW